MLPLATPEELREEIADIQRSRDRLLGARSVSADAATQALVTLAAHDRWLTGLRADLKAAT